MVNESSSDAAIAAALELINELLSTELAVDVFSDPETISAPGTYHLDALKCFDLSHAFVTLTSQLDARRRQKIILRSRELKSRACK